MGSGIGSLRLVEFAFKLTRTPDLWKKKKLDIGIEEWMQLLQVYYGRETEWEPGLNFRRRKESVLEISEYPKCYPLANQKHSI